MNNENKFKGEKSVKTAEIEELTKPTVETQQQIGNFNLDEWKKALEREKLELEIEKIRADKGKIEIETQELKKPFFRKQAFLQTALLALFTILISAFGLGWTIYYGVEQLKTGQMQAEKKDLEKDYSDLQKKNNDAIDLNKELVTESSNLGAQITQQKSEKERVLKEKEAIEIEGIEIKKEKAKIDDELKMLTAQSVIQQGLEQSRINDLQLKKEKLEERYKTIEERKAQLERDLMTAQIKGTYLLLKAVTVIPNFLTYESIETTIPQTVRKVSEETKYKLDNDAVYRETFTSFIDSQSQIPDEQPTSLMFGYVVSGEPKWKNELLKLAKERPFLFGSRNDTGRIGVTGSDVVMFSSLLTAFFDKEEDKILLFSLMLDALEQFDIKKRNQFLANFEFIFITMTVDETIPDKKVFLRLMSISRDDFIENGYGPGSNILFRRSLRAYFSVAGEILSENNDLCNKRFINITREFPNCSDESVRSIILGRAAVIGFLGESTGTPTDINQEIWQKWVENNKEIIDLWLEKDFGAFNQNDALYRKMTEDKQMPYFKLN